MGQARSISEPNKSIAAKAAISALKAISGVNLAGEVINAIVAAAIVAAIGEGSAFAFEKVCLGEMSAKDVDAIRDFKEQKLDNEFVRKVTRSLKISLVTIRVRIRSKIWLATWLKP